MRTIARKARTVRVRDMALAGSLIARAAFERRESRGSQYRSDFPAAGRRAARSYLRLETGDGARLLTA